LITTGGEVTAQELAAWAEQFKAKLATTDAIIRECEVQCARLALRWGVGSWRR
jgi:hypothetical protein